MEVSCEKCLIFVGLGPMEVSQITIVKYGLLSFALDSHKISSTKTMTKRTSKRLEGGYLYRSTRKLAVGEKVAYVQNTPHKICTITEQSGDCQTSCSTLLATGPFGD
jgi:hypothetical protein